MKAGELAADQKASWWRSAPWKALDFSGCDSRLGTGSLHPVDRMRRSTPDHGWR